MPSTIDHRLPKLRPIDAQPASQGGRRMLVLRDPQQISDKVVAIPLELGPILMLCDGTRDGPALTASLEARFGIRANQAIIDRFLEVCDQALLLDNDHYRDAQAGLLAHYRNAACREPSLAGLSYPDGPDELAREFEGYLQEWERRVPRNGGGRRLDEGGGSLSPGPHPPFPVGVISPHIDYRRGGPVYAATWRAAAGAARAADLVIAFGTDHYGDIGELTLTRQSYATPFGALPVPKDIVDALARAVGPEGAFANELHHRSEHAIELPLNWLHYVRRDLPPVPVLPILCGSFHHFVAGQARLEQDRRITALLHTLVDLTAGRRAVVVAGADLSHVGPAFGGEPQGAAECAQVQAVDREIMDRMTAGDARGFFESVRGVGDRYNVCGLSPIYMTLRYLTMARGGEDGPADGHGAASEIAYDICPADDAGTSFVSICGVVL